MEAWVPPDAWAGTSTPELNVILTEIDAGLPNGQRFSSAPNARERAAWKVIKRHYPEKNEGECREIIRAWAKSGALVEKDYYDPVRRNGASGLCVDALKRPGTTS